MAGICERCTERPARSASDLYCEVCETELKVRRTETGTFKVRVEELEQQLAKAKQLLTDLVDPTPCSLDHHGYCQEHLWFSSEGPCANKEAMEFLK